MNNFIGYRNYGVLAAEKRVVFTAEMPHFRAVTSEKVKIIVPDNCGWKLYETVSGALGVTSPWGEDYLLNEVIEGKEHPYFSAVDNDGKLKRTRLICEEIE